jgi:RNA polymerase sigma-70 factor (ECF subfamily)
MIITRTQRNRWLAPVAGLFTCLTLIAQTGILSSASAAQGPPRIVSTSPAVGATDVDPALTEITVTFDQDMGGGMSWTGGGPEFPPSPAGAQAEWRDKRTCVLPVKLERGHYYRVGINSQSYRNFRSAAGVPAAPSAIYFTTQGASEALKNKTQVPKLVSVKPPHGAKDVSPDLKELRVTFNVPMGESFSWTGGGPSFPTIPEGKKPYWTDDHKTCVLPVELKPNTQYRLGLNSPSNKGFQSVGGVPLSPVVYTFKTSGQ